jgi:hypothetical protein
MLSDLQSWTVVGVVGVIWLAFAFVGVVRGGPDELGNLADVLPWLFIGAFVFEHWAWRWSRLHPYLVSKPVVRGTWEGELKSEWKDPKSHKRRPPKIVYLSIDQTLATLRVRLLTDESASATMAGIVETQPTGAWMISYGYENLPELALRKKSRPHRGGALLTVVGQPPERIEGEYWTDRGSQGTLKMRRHVSGVAESFEDAQALFAASRDSSSVELPA